MTSSSRIRSWIRRWSHEPLLHFVLIGAGLFLILQTFSPHAGASATSNEIVVSEDDLRRLIAAWTTQRGGPPAPAQLEALVDQDVREEVLAREAVALGLDRDDPIIQRRLAQKMDFLAADVAALQDPGEAELREWYQSNSTRFAMPPRVSFHHLYFSSDRGARARDDAAAALDHIASDDGSPQPIADPFMFRDYYGERTPEQMAREFGPEFAKALFQLEPGAWSGPVQSGYGWHLVHVDALQPGHVPAFEEVASDVRQSWLENEQQLLRDKAYEAMRSRYKITLPDVSNSRLVAQRSSTDPQIAAEIQ